MNGLGNVPRFAWYALGALAVLALAFALQGYSLRILNLALINVLAVIGLNIVFGYCGLIHLGQAAFIGIGAYVSALLSVKLGWTPLVTIPVAVMAAGGFAALVSAPLLRLKGHYLALATVGVNITLELIAKNWVGLTGGYDGVSGIPRLAGDVLPIAPERGFAVLVGAIVLATVFLAVRLRESHWGRAMIAVRDDEIAASAGGVDVVRVKIVAFTLGSALGGLAGALYAHYASFISPTDFSVLQSITLLVMLIVGGEGSIIGAVIGALVITALPEALRFVGTWYFAIFGVLTLLVLVLMPKGIAGLFTRRARSAR
jgi:branched-chain amino acid transport system permease protein